MLKRTRLSFYYRRAARLVASAVILSLLTAVPASGQTRDHAHEGDHGAADSLSWRVPPIHDMTLPMMPSLVGLTPPEDPWLPGIGIDPATEMLRDGRVDQVIFFTAAMDPDMRERAAAVGQVIYKGYIDKLKKHLALTRRKP